MQGCGKTASGGDAGRKEARPGLPAPLLRRAAIQADLPRRTRFTRQVQTPAPGGLRPSGAGVFQIQALIDADARRLCRRQERRPKPVSRPPILASGTFFQPRPSDSAVPREPGSSRRRCSPRFPPALRPRYSGPPAYARFQSPAPGRRAPAASR